jgi:hypothetical protein
MARGRPRRHTQGVDDSVSRDGGESQGDAIVARLVPLLDSTHQVWSSTQERRRLRAFGFRPAVEEGVLTREWDNAQVRVGPDALRVVAEDGGGELAWSPASGLTLDGGPFVPTREGIALAGAINGLIQGYERWVEAREGREERLRRGHWSSADRRQVNALAETRRLQRLIAGGRATRAKRS